MDLTNETVTKTIHQIVNAKGADYVYEMKSLDGDEANSCLYVYDGKPDCLVGQVLHALGVSTDELSTFEGNGAYGVVRAVIGYPDALPAFVEALDAAQRKQDTGSTWGKALAEFDRVMAAEMARAA